MVKNKENITEIIMKPFAECLCAIGKDWYHIQFEVHFTPVEYYPDYMTVAKYISDNINGKEMNIETAVDTLGEMLKTTYNPSLLTVKGIVDKVVTHFPVEVIKTY